MVWKLLETKQPNKVTSQSTKTVLIKRIILFERFIYTLLYTLPLFMNLLSGGLHNPSTDKVHGLVTTWRRRLHKSHVIWNLFLRLSREKRKTRNKNISWCAREQFFREPCGLLLILSVSTWVYFLSRDGNTFFFPSPSLVIVG